MWNDTYLQQLTEADAFGGKKAEENSTEIKKDNLLDMLDAAYNKIINKNNNNCVFVLKDNNNNKCLIHSFYTKHEQNGLPMIYSKEDNSELINLENIGLKNNAQNSDINKIFYLYEIFISFPYKYVNMLVRYGYKLKNKDGTKGSEWNAAKAEMISKYQKSHGSEIMGSVANRLGQEAQGGWAQSAQAR